MSDDIRSNLRKILGPEVTTRSSSSDDLIRIDGVEYERTYAADGQWFCLRPKRKQCSEADDPLRLLKSVHQWVGEYIEKREGERSQTGWMCNACGYRCVIERCLIVPDYCCLQLYTTFYWQPFYGKVVE